MERSGRSDDDVTFTAQEGYLQAEVYREPAQPLPRVRLLDLSTAPARRLFDIDVWTGFELLKKVVAAVDEYIIALTNGHTEEG